MLHFASLIAATVIAICATIGSAIDGDETGEILLWSDASPGFNNYVEENGDLTDLSCYMRNTFFGTCNSNLAKHIRKNSARIEKSFIVGYFIDEVYDHDDLFAVKQSYGVSDYKYVEVLGIDLESGSQLYHRLTRMMGTKRYRIHGSTFDDFKNGLKHYSQLASLEVATVSDAIQLSHQVTEYVKQEYPEKSLVSLIAPSKAELDEITLRKQQQQQRRLLQEYTDYNYSACNGSDGDYCLDYWCNRTDWGDTYAYSDSCVNQTELLMLTLLVTIFLPFCCIGCLCMDGIHTPLRFPSRVLPVRKEF